MWISFSTPSRGTASVTQKPTIFSNTQVFKAISSRRQCHNWWLFCSRHSQWARNCCRQFSLISRSLCNHISVSVAANERLGNGNCSWRVQFNLHTCRASRDFPTLPQAFQLPLSIWFSLALHVIVIVGFATVANKICGTHQRCWASSNLFHFGDIIGHRSLVDEQMLVEPFASIVSNWNILIGRIKIILRLPISRQLDGQFSIAVATGIPGLWCEVRYDTITLVGPLQKLAYMIHSRAKKVTRLGRWNTILTTTELV